MKKMLLLAVSLSLFGLPAVAQTCAWSAVGGLDSTVNALTILPPAAGPALSGLYAGGFFTGRVAKWNGTAWGTVGGGMNNTVDALAAFDDVTGPVLVAGGQFTMAGGVAAKQIAEWNGTPWFELGGGIGTPPNEPVRALFFDGGTGLLYAAGNFTMAGGVPANRIAQWDGTEWSALGSGIPAGGVVALTVFDDAIFPLPPSPALYAGGQFGSAGGVLASNIAKWNGTQWSPLGTGVTGVVWALTVFDDGTGPALYAGGQFTTAGGVPANGIAKWNGTGWSALGSGAANVFALAADDAVLPSALYVGGAFLAAGGVPAANIARWLCN